MDRDNWSAGTDNIVVVEIHRRRLLWIPRDLWSPEVGDRVNQAFSKGGHELFQAAVTGLGPRITASIVVLRGAVERALRDVSINVPVSHAARYWYPLTPTSRLQDGARIVEFNPTHEVLEGERIHQWLGARRRADGVTTKLPDLDRIGRQQIFVRRLLEDEFDFRRLLLDPAAVSVSHSCAIDAVARVRANWKMDVLARVEPRTIDGKQVLVLRAGLLERIRDLLRTR